MHGGKINGLDGIRAIAALMVVFSHHNVYKHFGVNILEYPALFRVISPALGVKIFFVLSGFLITFLLLKEHNRFGKINLLQFYARRVLRLFPLYFLVVSLHFVLTKMALIPMEERSLLYLFTYTQNFMPAEYKYMSTSHLWSLAVEEHFYLVWPFLFMLSIRFALVSAVVFIGLATMFGDQFNPVWTFPAAIAIAVGCVLAYVIQNRWAQRAFTNKYTKYVLLIVSLVGILSPWVRYRESIYLPAVAGLIAFIFFNQESILTRLLEFKPLALIGVMSYGLYVWHAVLGGTGSYRTPDMGLPMKMEVGMILTIIVVPMSYYGFEKPFLALKERFRPKPLSTTEQGQATQPVVGAKTVGAS